MKRLSELRWNSVFGVGCAVVGLVAFGSLGAAEWTFYRGPGHDGVVRGEMWAVPGKAIGPAWRTQVGVGTASVVGRGGRIFTAGHLGGREVVQCMDVGTGKSVWQFGFDQQLDPNLFEGGARATPTLSGDRLLVQGHEGDLICLSAAEGKELWRRHLVRDFKGIRPEWGYSGAPLVMDGVVYQDCGGRGASTVAVSLADGRTVWNAGDDRAGYGTPVVMGIDGRRCLVMFKAEALVGLDLATGGELWRFPWKTAYDVNAATPLLVGKDRILISSGYNAGAAVVEINAGKVSLVWTSKVLRAHINSPVVLGDFVYGIDGNTGGGNLVCFDARTGQKVWEEKSVKGGALVLRGEDLVVVSEKGELVFAAASPSGFKARQRFDVLSKRVWAQPAVIDGRIFVRDNAGTMACLEVGTGFGR